MNQLLDRHLGVLKIEDTTTGYESMIRLRPTLGDLPIGRIDGATLDASSRWSGWRRINNQRCARSLRAGSSRVARPAVLAETGGDLVEASHRLTKRLDSARQVSKDLTLVLEASAAVRSGVRTEERT